MRLNAFCLLLAYIPMVLGECDEFDSPEFQKAYLTAMELGVDGSTYSSWQEEHNLPYVWFSWYYVTAGNSTVTYHEDVLDENNEILGHFTGNTVNLSLIPDRMDNMVFEDKDSARTSILRDIENPQSGDGERIQA